MLLLLQCLLLLQGARAEEKSRPLWQRLDVSDPSALYSSLWSRTSSSISSNGLGEEAGGGLFEEHLRRTLDDSSLSRKFEALTKGEQLAQRESRDLRCCEHLEVRSSGGLASTHPYVLGSYTKIGECGGRSFYRHLNNSDIFLYHACTAWYFGLSVGSCGGWMLAHSTEPCVTSSKNWKYYDEGQLNDDQSFEVVADCKLFHDFRPLPPGIKHPYYAPHFEPVSPSALPPKESWPVYREKTGSTSSVHKHEHFHYHFRMDEGQNQKYRPIIKGNNDLFGDRSPSRLDSETIETPQVVINNVNINSEDVDDVDKGANGSNGSGVSVVLRKRKIKKNQKAVVHPQHSRSVETQKKSEGVDVLDLRGKFGNND